MKDLTVSVKKLTGEDLMRAACESTFIGKSRASLLDLYKAEHSPARTQLFWVTLTNVKLFVSTHLLRHHVGSIPFQLTCRDDRKGGNPGMEKKCAQIKANILGSVELMKSGNIDIAEEQLVTCMDELQWLSENADRNTPVTLSLLINAQSLIDMAKLRLCKQAHIETQEAFNAIREGVAKVDPDLASMMVRKCVYRGGLCGEQRCCGFNRTEQFADELKTYVDNFTLAQRGIVDVSKK